MRRVCPNGCVPEMPTFGGAADLDQISTLGAFVMGQTMYFTSEQHASEGTSVPPVGATNTKETIGRRLETWKCRFGLAGLEWQQIRMDEDT